MLSQLSEAFKVVQRAELLLMARSLMERPTCVVDSSKMHTFFSVGRHLELHIGHPTLDCHRVLGTGNAHGHGKVKKVNTYCASACIAGQ